MQVQWSALRTHPLLSQIRLINGAELAIDLPSDRAAQINSPTLRKVNLVRAGACETQTLNGGGSCVVNTTHNAVDGKKEERNKSSRPMLNLLNYPSGMNMSAQSPSQLRVVCVVEFG